MTEVYICILILSSGFCLSGFSMSIYSLVVRFPPTSQKHGSRWTFRRCELACNWVGEEEGAPSGGVFPPYSQCSWNSLQMDHNPDQDKALTESKEVIISCTILSKSHMRRNNVKQICY